MLYIKNLSGHTKLLLLFLFVLGLLVANLLLGSVHIPADKVVDILCGEQTQQPAWQFIVMESRLPQAVTALLSGAALAVSGLMLQTAFRNPLAGPDVFGINSGAGLGVALVMLAMGGSVSAGTVTLTGFAAVLVAAFAGAMLVTAIIFGFALVVRQQVMLLIIGLMMGYLAGSVISLLNFMATEEGVKSYMVWGLGNFGGVSLSKLPLFTVACLTGLGGSALLIKPLNALMLGSQYAESLGFRVQRVRRWLLITTGWLTAVVTAFCGPVAFIGLAVPHIARLLLNTANHRILLPGTLLCGAMVALLCQLLCCLPGDRGIIPLNAVTPLMGAPVIIYVIIKKRKE